MNDRQFGIDLCNSIGVDPTKVRAIVITCDTTGADVEVHYRTDNLATAIVDVVGNYRLEPRCTEGAP